MSLIIDVKVVPSSGRIKWVLEANERLKCYLKSPPEKGKANRELIRLFAKALKLPQNKIQIVSGATSRAKRVQIEQNVTFDTLLAALGIERQLNIFA